MLENQGVPVLLQQQNNCFLLDWLSVTFHGCDPGFLKWLLGLDGADIVWDDVERFQNGYPAHFVFHGITISYGADDPKFYKDAAKARTDMGVLLNMSGTGCRAFETYGNGNWLRLFRYIFHDPKFDLSRDYTFFRTNITRLDVAYDDHVGILDIHRMAADTQARYFRSRSTWSELHFSDDQKKDIHGTTLYFGAKTSPVLLRIYDKAAERGFNDVHWIRVEMQLRDERAKVFAALFLNEQHLGKVAAGVLRNYLCFLEPTNDSNRSRWPLADYWDKLLLDMEKISLWITPGEEYNFAKSEYWFWKQWGAVVRVLDLIYGSDYLAVHGRRMFPESELPPKYKRVVDEYRSRNRDPQLEKQLADAVWDSYSVKVGLVEQLQIIPEADRDCPW